MVTIVIPVFNLTEERYRNFWFVFSRICSEDIPIIVAEQYSDSPMLAFPKGIVHIKYHSNSENIEKSRLINMAAKEVKTEYVWVNDADIWIDYGNVMKTLESFKDDCLKPFKYFLKFDSEESKNFIARKPNSMDFKKREKISDYGAGSFIVRTDILVQNPLNEEFVGWGCEDIEWGRKISEKYSIKSNNLVGVHLYHPQFKPNKSKNEKVYKRIKKETHIYHVLNLVEFDVGSRLHEEQCRTVKSVEVSCLRAGDRVHLIAAYDDRKNPEISEKWSAKPLCRTADRFIDGSKNYAYIKDLLDKAHECAEDRDDWLLFTNSDCFCADDFHREILSNMSEVILFHRDDIDKNGKKKIFEIGVDGIAVRKYVWEKIRDSFDDYLIGVPHWDTYAWYFFVKNSKFDVSNNLGGLMHYKHERTWDFYNPDAPGQYAKDLLISYLKKTKTDLKPMSLDNPGDTALIVAVWGRDDNRTASARKFLSKIKKQFLKFDLFFVELLFDDAESSFAEDGIKNHIIIRGSDRNMNIFQKEALWNIGAEYAKNYKYFIFCDADIWSDDSFWFYKIRNKILEDPRTVVQGANFSNDSKDENMNFQTLLGYHLLSSSERNRNPGLIYGMTAEYHGDIGGFNPLFLASCGDSGFVNEVFSSRNYETFLRRFKIFKNNFRNVKEAIPSVVDVDVVHENHGSMDTRNYANVDFAINSFRRDLKDIVQVGKDNIVEWIDPECKERLIYKEAKNMKKRKDIIGIFEKYGVSHLPRRIIFNHLPYATYDLVEDYLSGFFKVFRIGLDGKDVESGIPYWQIEYDGTFVLSGGQNVFSPSLFVPEKTDFYMTFIRHPHRILISDYSFCRRIRNQSEIPVNFVKDNGGIPDSKKMSMYGNKYIDWFVDSYEKNKSAYMSYFQNLEKYDFVGFSDKIESSLMSLCQNLLLEYRKNDIYCEDEVYLVSTAYRKVDVEKVLSSQIQIYGNLLDYLGY